MTGRIVLGRKQRSAVVGLLRQLRGPTAIVQRGDGDVEVAADRRAWRINSDGLTVKVGEANREDRA